ncbi:MAG: VCBS repeat-containing protein [Kiritimatiellae bacterium]|nr:VCBS repeat-containing protein [Kiritimatiellia bacterium]
MPTKETEWELTILDAAPPVKDLGSLAAGDVDGDGRVELLTGGDGALLWYRPATFEKGIVAAGTFNVGLALVDLDGDGILEAIAGQQDSESEKHTVSWFKPSKDLNAPWTRHVLDPDCGAGAHDVVAVDLDGDGELELVVTPLIRNAPRLYAYKRTADITAPWQRMTVAQGFFAEGTCAGDVDGDGRVQIVNGPALYTPPAEGPFAGAWARTVYAHGFRDMCRTALVDITGTGRPDIVVVESEYPDGRLSWFENRVTENPGAPWLEHPMDPGDMPMNFAHSLWARREGDTVRVFVAEMAAGGWNQPYNWDARLVEYTTADNGETWNRNVLHKGAGTHEAVMIDVDNDGELEVVGKEWGRARRLARVHVWKRRNSPSPLTRFRHHFVDLDKPQSAVDILPVDVDGDGKPDVACGAWWYRNPTWERQEVPGITQILNAHDIDGDGRIEFIAMKRNGDTKGAGLNSDLCWLRPTDAQAGTWEQYPIGSGDEKEWVHATAIAPLLPGGRLALVTGYHGAAKAPHPPHIFEIPADPTQTPWPKRILADIPYGEEIIPYDLNGNGTLDLIAGPYWLENRGDGTFKAHQLADIQDVARIRIADVNGDGRPDIVYVVEDVDYKAKIAGFVEVGWLENPGNGATGNWPNHVIDKVRSPHSLDVADLDGDGEPEIIVGEHDPFAPYRSRSRLLVYKKADPRARAWRSYTLDDRFEHHDGTKVFELCPGRLAIASHGWKDSTYVHLWVQEAPHGH